MFANYQYSDVLNNWIHFIQRLDIESTIVYDRNVKPDIVWDGKDIPCESSSFDTVFMTEVPEHSYKPDQTLGECHRVLREDGIIFLQCHLFGHCTKRHMTSIDIRRMHLRSYYKMQVSEIFRSNQAEDGMQVWHK